MGWRVAGPVGPVWPWKSFMKVALLIFLVAGISRQMASAEGEAKPPDAEARSYVRELLLQRPEVERQVRCELKIRDGTGKRRDVSIEFATVPGAQAWQDIYRTTGNAGGEQLAVVHRGERPNQYFYHSGRTDGQPAVLDGSKANVPFAGSDFWLSDLGMEFLHWPEQRLVRDRKTNMKMGRPCRIVESVNPKPEPGNYSRVVSWIDREFGGIIYAEAYDFDGELMKVFSLKGFKKVDGVAQIKEMEMRNEKMDSRTRLEFFY